MGGTANLRQVTVTGDAVGAAVVAGDNNVVTIVYGAGVVRAATFTANPYRGLDSFDEASTRFFFGREDLVKRIAERLEAAIARSHRSEDPRFLAIIGPSGSGKSSIARAGLIPELARSASPFLRDARVTVLRPGHDPLYSLADAVQRVAAGGGGLPAVLRELEEAAMSGGAGLADYLKGRLGEGGPVIFLVDQFEEVYSLRGEPRPDDADGDRRRRAAFTSGLLRVASVRGGNISLVVTLRSDFFGAAAEHPDFSKAVADHHELVPALTHDGLRRAILNPLLEAQRDSGQSNTAPLMDDATADRIVEQAEQDAAALPLLQFALSQIWDGLRQGVEPSVTLSRIGGVGGALAFCADDLYDALDPEGRKIAKAVFLGTVQLADLPAYDTRRRLSLAEIATQDAPVEVLRKAVEPFVAARLLTTGSTADGAIWVELPHEALIRSWNRLRGWTEEHREDLRFSQRVQGIAAEWDRVGRPKGSLWREPDLSLLRRHAERLGRDVPFVQNQFLQASVEQARRERRVRVIGLAAIVLLTLAALAGAFFANRQAAIAERQRVSADLALARSLVSDARPVDALAVLRPHLAAGSDDSIDPDLAGVLAQALYRNHLAASTKLKDVKRLAWADGERLVAETGTETRIYSSDLKLLSSRPSHYVERESNQEPYEGEGYKLYSPDRSKHVFSQDYAVIEVRDGSDRRLFGINDRVYQGEPSRQEYNFSPNSEFLYIGHTTAFDTSTRPEVVEADTGRSRFTLETDNVLLSAFSPGSDRLATFDADGKLSVWSVAKNVFSGYNDIAPKYSYVDEGASLGKAGADGFLLIESRPKPRGHFRQSGFWEAISPAISADHKLFLFATGERSAELWSLEGSGLLRRFTAPTDIRQLSFSPRGRFAIVGEAGRSSFGSAERLDEPWRPISAGSGGFRFDDAEAVVLASQEGDVEGWDLATGRSMGRVADSQLGYESGKIFTAVLAGARTHLWTGDQCQFAFSPDRPPAGTCAWSEGELVRRKGGLAFLVGGGNALQVLDPVTLQRQAELNLGRGKIGSIDILNDRMAAVFLPADNRNYDKPPRFDLVLVDYVDWKVAATYTGCLGKGAAACGRTIVFLRGPLLGTARMLPADVAQLAYHAPSETIWAVDKTGAIMTIDRAGAIDERGEIKPDEAARLSGALDTPTISIHAGKAAMLCTDGPCLALDLGDRSATFLAKAGCNEASPTWRPDFFSCTETNHMEEVDTGLMFRRTEGRWTAVDPLPKTIRDSYPAPWITQMSGSGQCQQALVNYANLNADAGYAGAEIWDLINNRSIMHFDTVMTAARGERGQWLATSFDPPRVRLGSRIMRTNYDAVPLLCGRRDALRLIEELLISTGRGT